MCKNAPNLRSSSAIWRLNSFGTSPIAKRTSIPLSSYILRGASARSCAQRGHWQRRGAATLTGTAAQGRMGRARAPVDLALRRWEPRLPRMRAPLLVLFLKAGLRAVVRRPAQAKSSRIAAERAASVASWRKAVELQQAAHGASPSLPPGRPPLSGRRAALCRTAPAAGLLAGGLPA